MKTEAKDALVKVTVEIRPTERKSGVKEFRKVIEFQVDEADLPLRVQAHSARTEKEAAILAEEMCED